MPRQYQGSALRRSPRQGRGYQRITEMSTSKLRHILHLPDVRNVAGLGAELLKRKFNGTLRTPVVRKPSNMEGNGSLGRSVSACTAPTAAASTQNGSSKPCSSASSALPASSHGPAGNPSQASPALHEQRLATSSSK